MAYEQTSPYSSFAGKEKKYPLYPSGAVSSPIAPTRMSSSPLGSSGYSGYSVAPTPSQGGGLGGYDSFTPPPNSSVAFPTGGGGQGQTSVPGTSYVSPPYATFNPMPTQQSIISAGGQVNKRQNGTDIFGNPSYDVDYQLPLAGFGNPTRGQQAALDALNKLSSSSGSYGGYSEPLPINTGSVPREQFQQFNVPPIDTRDAQNAAFGATKARAGALGRSALDSLRANLAERGILGGGTEARGLVDRLAASTNPLSDLNVAQLNENVGLAQHAQDLGQQQSLSRFNSNIAQRGQDINSLEEQAAIAERRAARQQQQQLSIINALRGLAY